MLWLAHEIAKLRLSACLLPFLSVCLSVCLWLPWSEAAPAPPCKSASSFSLAVQRNPRTDGRTDEHKHDQNRFVLVYCLREVVGSCANISHRLIA